MEQGQCPEQSAEGIGDTFGRNDLHHPEIHQQGRRHAETDEISERIQLRAQLGRDAQQPGDAPVEPVQHTGNDDRDDGRPPMFLALSG
jgi:hypothetical protein